MIKQRAYPLLTSNCINNSTNVSLKPSNKNTNLVWSLRSCCQNLEQTQFLLLWHLLLKVVVFICGFWQYARANLKPDTFYFYLVNFYTAHFTCDITLTTFIDLYNPYPNLFTEILVCFETCPEKAYNSNFY